jgi:tRNA(fMet)-specific endonuclease VapC
MPKTLLDTDILSMLMRQQREVVKRAIRYLDVYNQYSFSLMTHYEILRGLKTKNAEKQLAAFNVFCQASEVLPITESVVNRASDIYAALHHRGEPIGDGDILIAATALEYGFVLATNNENHFSRIVDIQIDNWSRLSNSN